MNKRFFILVICIISFLPISCLLTDKYELKHIYVAEQLELSDQSIEKPLSFIATRSSKDRFILKLTYPEIKQTLPDDVYNSLIGFSVQLFDQTADNTLLFSHEITGSTDLSITLNSIYFSWCFLINIIESHHYIIKLKVPEKRDTEEQYLRPMFVAGILPDQPL